MQNFEKKQNETLNKNERFKNFKQYQYFIYWQIQKLKTFSIPVIYIFKIIECTNIECLIISLLPIYWHNLSLLEKKYTRKMYQAMKVKIVEMWFFFFCKNVLCHTL